jgi:hypothetical protein
VLVLPALLGSPHIAFSPMIDAILRMVRDETSNVVSVCYRVYCEKNSVIIIDLQDLEGALVGYFIFIFSSSFDEDFISNVVDTRDAACILSLVVLVN